MEDVLKPLSDFLDSGNFSGQTGGLILFGAMLGVYLLQRYTSKSLADKAKDAKEQHRIADEQRLSVGQESAEAKLRKAMEAINRTER